MFFLGDPIDAERALQLGLVNRVVAPEDLEAETRKLAERLRDGPAVSIAAAKHAVYAAEHDTLEKMLQYEVRKISHRGAETQRILKQFMPAS
jgi:enoyl-CoA hydratase/carnithine racemase